MSLSFSQAGATSGDRRLRFFPNQISHLAHKIMTEPEDRTPICYDVCSPSFKEKSNPKTVKDGVEGGKGGCMTFPNEMDRH